MYRDGTGQSQIGPTICFARGHAVLRSHRLLAQGVHFNLSARRAAENMNEAEIEVEAQDCSRDQVDSAGNTTGSASCSVGVEQFDCAD